MIYDSFDSIFNAYQEYARQTEFNVPKRVLKSSKYAFMACDKSRVLITQKSSKRVGCPARLIAIRKDDGFCVISKTVTEHNHDLDPTMSILMPAHMKIDVHMKRLLEANDIIVIRPSKNIRLCEVQAGDGRRRFRLGVGDEEVIRKLFARLQHRDIIFFHLIDIDDGVSRKFQEEIDRMVYCHIVPATENDDDGVVDAAVQKFYVLDRSLRNNFRSGFIYKVEYRPVGEYLNCKCHEFEFRGLLRCHILTVITMKDIHSINERIGL
ncbi:hypothetical protein ACS0TY_006870 [Phlomoides rotata]